MNKQQYQDIRSRFRENCASTTSITHFPIEQRDDVRRLMDLRDRADMLAVRAWEIGTWGDKSCESTRRNILPRTAPSRVMRQLAAKYPTGLAEAFV